VVAADSATAAILAGGVSPLAAPASARYVALASLVALLTAGMLLLARLLRLGFLADFLSQTVLVGFLTGVGFQVGIAVLGEMLGLPTHSHRTVGQLAEVFGGLRDVNSTCVWLSAAVWRQCCCWQNSHPGFQVPCLPWRRRSPPVRPGILRPKGSP
jgi:MFS superfamily sulfate permease-like transporter